MQRFTDYTEKAVARRKMSAAEAEKVRANVHATTDYTVAREADWAIEAATEDLALKRKIFAQLEALMRPDAWITSNTSSLPAARIFADLRHRNRATVTHFFAPAWRNPVVEVIDTPALDRAVLEDLRWLFCIDRQGAAGYRRRAVLHARPRVRQLVQRSGASVGSRERGRDQFDGGGIRPRRAVLRAQSRQRQSDHRRDQYAAGRRGRRALSSGGHIPHGRDMEHGLAGQNRAGCAGDRGGHPRPPARHFDFAERRYSRSQHRRSGGPRARLPSGARLQIRAAGIDGQAWRAGGGADRQAPGGGAAGPAAAETRPGRLPEFPSRRAGRRRARREDHHHPPSRSAQRAA